MCAKHATDLTVIKLKEELRKLGLSSALQKWVDNMFKWVNSLRWIEQQSDVQAIEDTGKIANEGSIHGTEIQPKSQPRDVRILENWRY